MPNRLVRASVLALLLMNSRGFADFGELRSINRQIAGQVLYYSGEFGASKGVYSPWLARRQDVFVYLPPGYDGAACCPLLLWLHGAFGDEHEFLSEAEIPYLDALIRSGNFPPVVVVAPDISCRGRNCVLADHSFGIDGHCGYFESNLLHDVLPWAESTFRVACNRQLQMVVGLSAGGAASFHLALKHPRRFGAAASISGAINLRYGDRQGGNTADFNPATFYLRESFLPRERVGQIGPFSLRAGRFVHPVFGRGDQVPQRVERENPTDLLIRGAQQQAAFPPLLVSYGKQDEFNFDAHAESFIYLARQWGVAVDVDCDPRGDHRHQFFVAAQRRAYQWLGNHLLMNLAPPNLTPESPLESP